MKFRLKAEGGKFVVQRSLDNGKSYESISSPFATEAEARSRLEIHHVQAVGRLPLPGEIPTV